MQSSGHVLKYGGRAEQLAQAGDRLHETVCAQSVEQLGDADRRMAERRGLFHRARTIPAFAIRMSRSRNGAGYSTHAS